MRRNEEGIRSYPHLGKFEGEMLVTSFLYGIEGEQIGDPEDLGWYGRIDLSPKKERREFISDLNNVAKEEGEKPLTLEEEEMVMDTVGIITNENEDGFFSATWYDNSEEFKQDWEGIELDYEKFYEEVGEEA